MARHTAGRLERNEGDPATGTLQADLPRGAPGARMPVRRFLCNQKAR